MRLHKERAEREGAEPGVIPAPPAPSGPSHLQTMLEKQKRIHTPSRMPPPELRRRAEVTTLSPEQIKERPSSSDTPALAQRHTVSSSAPAPETPVVATSPSSADVAPAFTETPVTLPSREQPVVEGDMSTAAATPAPIQREIQPPVEPTLSATPPTMTTAETRTAVEPVVTPAFEPATTPATGATVQRQAVPETTGSSVSSSPVTPTPTIEAPSAAAGSVVMPPSVPSSTSPTSAATFSPLAETIRPPSVMATPADVATPASARIQRQSQPDAVIPTPGPSNFAAADIAPSPSPGTIEPDFVSSETASVVAPPVVPPSPTLVTQRQSEPGPAPMASVASEPLPLVRARAIGDIGVRPGIPVQREMAPVAAATPPITHQVEPTEIPTATTASEGNAAAMLSSASLTPLTPTTPMVLPAMADQPLPDMAVPSPVAPSPVQRTMSPAAATSTPVDTMDMPTMVMPTPTVAPVTYTPTIPTPSVSHPAPPVQRTPEASTPTALSASEVRPEIAAQPEGLEAVWPVQRVEAAKPKGDELPLDPVTVDEPMRHDKPEASQIQQVMRQVSAAKPSDSSVELILPRRQRPTPTPTPARIIQTKPEVTQSDGGGLTRPQSYVATDIGPLPSDLWEILGAPTPGQTTPAGPIPQSSSPAVMRAIAAAERPTPVSPTGATPAHPLATGTHRTNGHPPAIQREETHSEQASGQSRPTNVVTVGSGLPAQTAQSQGSETSGGTGPAGQGEGEKNNVDELARQVYHEVRRRLAIEWERGRGQF